MITKSNPIYTISLSSNNNNYSIVSYIIIMTINE